MTRFIAHLKLWQKYALVSTLALTMMGVSTALALHDRYQIWQATQDEVAGLPAARQLTKLLQLTQQHRGLSASWLSGNDSVGPARQTRQIEVERASQATRTALATLAMSSGRSDLLSLMDEIDIAWRSVATASLTRTIQPPESFRRHGAIIAQELKLLEQIIDASGLVLDPEASSYYLIVATLDNLPHLAESLGQARARGTAILASQSKTPDDQAFSSIIASSARLQLDKSRAELDKSANSSIEVRNALQTIQARSLQAADEAIQLLVTKVIQPDHPSFSASEFLALTTRHIDSQFELISSGLDTLESLLSQRGAQLKQALLLLSCAAGISLLLTLWFTTMVVRTATRATRHALYAARALAQGDLSQQLDSPANDEIGELVNTLGRSIESLATTFGHVRNSLDSVNTAALQIAAGTQDLSVRTEQQAHTLETTSRAMQGMDQSVHQNSSHAARASELAEHASEVASHGGEAMSRVIATMHGINESSRRIADINAVIDGIAFQTNILALNAAVEAARAGEHGRGFAVVASEVRSLAGRAAAAAREIKQLIDESVGRVEAGSLQVDAAGRSMDDIVRSIQQVTQTMANIRTASENQTYDIVAITGAIEAMDHMTQQNAALVEETAAASESLKGQAQQVARAMARFKLRD